MPLHAQDAADDLPDPAEAADDDRRRARVDRVIVRHRRARCQPRDQQRFRGGEEHRRGHHRRRRSPGSRSAAHCASAPAATAAPNSTKLNSLPCGSARAKRSAFGRIVPPSGRAGRRRRLGAARASTVAAASSRRLRSAPGRRSRRHADRDEEEAEQQALERLDIGLQLVAVFGFREQHAGHEGAERHATGRPTLASAAVPATMSSATAVNTSGVCARRRRGTAAASESGRRPG